MAINFYRQSVCCMCGHLHPVTWHHKIPRSQGGSDRASNLVGLCRPCHDCIEGTGPGCQSAYPDMVAAAEACAAHWNAVMHSWEREREILPAITGGKSRMSMSANRYQAQNVRLLAGRERYENGEWNQKPAAPAEVTE